MASMRFAKLLRNTALVAIFVAAQTVAAVHAELEDSHPTDEICALCVGFATFGTGNVAAPQQFDRVAQRAEPTEYLYRHPIALRSEHRFARGPPKIP